jgi:hypothetical protein
VIDEGRPKQGLKKPFKETFPSLFLDYLQPKLEAFVKHNFIARCQDTQMLLSMANFPTNTIFSHIDFVEIYTF